MSFESGVKYYTAARVRIFFPEDRVCCGFCPLLETYSRKQCRATGEYILDDRTFGRLCPLEIEEEKGNE